MNRTVKITTNRIYVADGDQVLELRKVKGVWTLTVGEVEVGGGGSHQITSRQFWLRLALIFALYIALAVWALLGIFEVLIR